MTITIKSEKIGKYHLEIAQDKYSTSYKVTLSHTFDGDLYYMDKQGIYSTLKKANNRFSALKREISR